jgi:hypothetical protein
MTNDNFLFGFYKKKPKPVQTDRFRFGFLGHKPVQTGLARFFFGFGSVQFGFFGFRLIKPKPNRTGRVFFTIRFFLLFFFQFSWFFDFFSVWSIQKIRLRANLSMKLNSFQCIQNLYPCSLSLEYFFYKR